jgi:hypothetical protein
MRKFINNFIFKTLVFLSIVFFSCQNESEIDKIVVYESFATCICDTTIKNVYRNECKIQVSDRMVIKGLKGTIMPKNNPLDKQDNIELDANQDFLTDTRRFPKWPPSPKIVEACNLPIGLSKSSEKIKVKVDINIFYVGINIDVSTPQLYNYYPVELLRLEIIK